MSNQGATETEEENAVEDSMLKDKEKQEKFIRLLGGKKSHNKDATSAWVKKGRTEEEERNLAEGLENQYTSTMSKVVQGKTRRHEGIGFEKPLDSKSEKVASQQDSDTRGSRPAERNVHTTATETSRRERSRSPLDRSKNGSNNDKTENSSEKPTTPITNKKQFYMQFAKSSG